MSVQPVRKTVVGMSNDYLKASQKFMLEDLARSGLVPEDMECVADEVNTETNKHKRILINASYVIPFYDIDGSKLQQMCRTRRQLRPGSEGLKDLGKYTQPHITMAGGYGRYPYIPKQVWGVSGDVLHICEGEKKTAALIKHAGVRAIGLTGKDVAKETVRVIAEVVRRLDNISKISRICIWPDADIQRFDVFKSYGRLRAKLLGELYDLPGINIEVVQPSWDVRKWKGIDDALAGGWQFEIGKPVGDELPIDMRGLADELGLDYTVGADGDKFNLAMTEDNICRILEHEPLWGRLALNTDTGSWMSGGEELQDPDIEVMSFTRRMQRVFGLRRVSRDMVGACVDHVCRLHERSPWNDYLENSVWDGVGRLDGWLSRACGAESGDEFISEVGTKWMVGAVARSINPGSRVDWMMILSGPQSCGKSSLPKALMPEGFESLVMPAPHAQDKDLQQAAGMCRILCFDEMAVFFKNINETEFIKQFVTAIEDVMRPPYGKATIRKPRGSVLFGSTNRKDDILKFDPSGQRRWAIVDVKGVVKTQFADQFDWKWINENREQLWAEAVALWRAGELDYAQVRGASERAAGRVAEPEEWDKYVAVLNRLLTGEKLRADIGKGFRVSNNEFSLAFREMWGKDHYQGTLNSFWARWNCEVVKSNGVRLRAISTELLDALRGAGG